MSEATPPIDRIQAKLDQLAEMDLAAAEHVHAQLMAADAPALVCDLARAYQRAARCLRQSLLLQMKHDRAAAEAAARRERLGGGDAAPAGRDEDPAVIERVLDLQDAVGRVGAAALPDETERLERLLDDMDLYLDYDTRRPDFLTQDLDAHVAAHCARLDFPAEIAAQWRDLPPAPWTVAPDAEDPVGADGKLRLPARWVWGDSS